VLAATTVSSAFGEFAPSIKVSDLEDVFFSARRTAISARLCKYELVETGGTLHVCPFVQSLSFTHCGENNSGK
jgi:hypothetical protein